MPTGPNIDLGNDLIIQGLVAQATNDYLVAAMDVSQYKSIILYIKSNAYSGTLLFEGADYDQVTWNAINLYQLSNTAAILATTHTSANNLVFGGPILYPWFRVRMNPYTSGAALATLQLSRDVLPGVQLATINTATVLDSSNNIGWIRNGGRSKLAIPAGTVADTVISANANGELSRLLVTTAGTHEMVFFDNASVGSGDIIAIIPASTTRGTIIPCLAAAPTGITAKGDANNPAVTVFYS